MSTILTSEYHNYVLFLDLFQTCVNSIPCCWKNGTVVWRRGSSVYNMQYKYPSRRAFRMGMLVDFVFWIRKTKVLIRHHQRSQQHRCADCPGMGIHNEKKEWTLCSWRVHFDEHKNLISALFLLLLFKYVHLSSAQRYSIRATNVASRLVFVWKLVSLNQEFVAIAIRLHVAKFVYITHTTRYNATQIHNSHAQSNRRFQSCVLFFFQFSQQPTHFSFGRYFKQSRPRNIHYSCTFVDRMYTLCIVQCARILCLL